MGRALVALPAAAIQAAVSVSGQRVPAVDDEPQTCALRTKGEAVGTDAAGAPRIIDDRGRYRGVNTEIA